MLDRFEEEFAARFGARFAIGVSSGTAALHLAVLAAGVTDGDLVLTTPFSFVASANVILYERATPVFVDVDPVTLTIDPDAAIEAMKALVVRSAGWERLLPPRGAGTPGKLRAVIPVDLFGRIADLQRLVAAARELGITVIEDACEAVGATLDGVPAGRWGDIGTFAFFPNKQMTTGEGGMILTDHEPWALLMRSLRNQGRGVDGAWLRHDRLGYNYRLDDLSAALGVAQLRRLDELLLARETVAAMYAQRLASVDGVAPVALAQERMTIAWFVYMIRVDDDIDRNQLSTRLAARGIDTRPYFWPIHLQSFYRERFGFEPGAFPHAEKAGNSLLALPFHHNLSAEDIEFICAVLEEETAACRTALSAGGRR